MGLYNVAWGVVVLPILGALMSFLAETARRAVQVCVVCSAGAMLLAAVVLGARLTHAYAAPFDNTISFFGVNPPEGGTFPARFEPFFGIHVDAMSASFSFVIAFALLMVQLYALTSLRGDTGYRRFAWASSLLGFAALGIVLSPNLFQSLFMWMAASVALYLLTLHWWQREDAASPARRIFAVLHSSDLALLLATAFLFVKLGIFASTEPAPAGQDITDPFSFTTIGQEVTGLVQHHVLGAGLRTLAILSALFIFAVVVRTAQAGFHAWLADTATTPVPVMAAIVSLGMVPAIYLLARLYPVLAATPHALTALALTAAVSAVVVSAVCLSQRDVLRVALLSAVAQMSMALIALSGGGFGEGLFIAFTATIFSVLGLAGAGNLVRLYRTRNLLELGGARRRMPATTAAIGVWALGVGGLALQTYYALAAVFFNNAPGHQLGSATRAVVAALVVVAAVVLTLAAVRLLVRALSGEPVARRGFRADRVVEVEPPLRLTTTLLTAGAVLAVLVGLPAIGGAGHGRSRLPALSFIHFVHYGTAAQQTSLNGGALMIALAACAAGCAGAFLLFAPAGRTRTAVIVAGMRPLVRLLGQDLYLDRTTRWVVAPFALAGRLGERFDEGVLDALPHALAQGGAVSAWWVRRLRTPRSGMHLAGGLAAIVVLVLLSVLAATGHLGAGHGL